MLTNKAKLEQLRFVLCNDKNRVMAQRLGISEQSVGQWFKNNTFDSDKLAAAFPEVSSDWLLRGTGPMLEADVQADEQFALDTLGITAEEVKQIKENRNAPASVPAASPAGNKGNKENVPVRTHEEYSLESSPLLSVAEPTATSQCSSLDMITIPRAVLNALTQQLDVKDAQIDTLLRQLQQHEKK